MGIHEKLIKIQKALKAPKGQFNSFGNYKYRSCEDILEAVKPLLNDATLILTDELVLVGDRYYIKATALFEDKDENIAVHAWARESLDKKGMDASQITGTASSYARKYALNGLFLIDDTKDADTMDNTNGGNGDKPAGKGKVDALKDKLKFDVKPPVPGITVDQWKDLQDRCKNIGRNPLEILKLYGVSKGGDLPASAYAEMIVELN
jgi:hypothetical protein